MIGKGCLAQAEVMYGSHSASRFSIFWLQNRPYRPIFSFFDSALANFLRHYCPPTDHTEGRM